MTAPAERHDHHGVGRTVLIVDDQQEFRALARLLLTDAGYDVIGEAGDGAEAAAEAARLRPDVVLLDVQLPDVDGFTVAATITDLPRPPMVVMTSSRAERSYRWQLSTSRARAFIAKERLSADAMREALGS